MEQSNAQKIESIRKRLEEYEEKGYEKEFEEEWKTMLNDLNDLKIIIYKNKMFSDNEEFTDVKTEDIKFMLIAYYQSQLIQKFQANRKNLLQFGLKFYSEFYKLLESYNYLSKEQIGQYKSLTRFNEPNNDDDKKPKRKETFEQLSEERKNKIEQYKYKKALSEKLKRIEKEKNYDDNREYWISYLDLNIVTMFDNLRMIKMELESLDYLAKMKENKGNQPPEEEKPREKMEMLRIKSPKDLANLDPNNKLVQNMNFMTTSSNPQCVECFHMINGGTIKTLDQVILEKNTEFIRKDVFKNNNPTTMTMDEFAELQMQHMKEDQEKAEMNKQNKEDSDSDHDDVDDRKKKKARDWDDWKDDNPKGSGNRMGK